MDNLERYAQYRTAEGHKMKAVYIGPDIYNDNVLLMRYLTRFIDGYELKKIEFLKYEGFNAVKVSSIYEREFYVTIEPSEDRSRKFENV